MRGSCDPGRVSSAASRLTIYQAPASFLATRPWALIFSMMQRSRWGAGSCGRGCWLRYLRPPSRVFRHTHLFYFVVPRLFLPSTIVSTLVALSSIPTSVLAPIPTLLCLFLYSAPFRPRPCSHHRFPPPVPGVLFSPRYNIVGQAPGLSCARSCWLPPGATYVCVWGGGGGY